MWTYWNIQCLFGWSIWQHLSSNNVIRNTTTPQLPKHPKKTSNTVAVTPVCVCVYVCVCVRCSEVSFVTSTTMCFLFFALFWSDQPRSPRRVFSHAHTHTSHKIINNSQTNHRLHSFLLGVVARWNMALCFQKLLFPSFMLFLESLHSLHLFWEVVRMSVCLFVCVLVYWFCFIYYLWNDVGNEWVQVFYFYS